MQPNSSDQDDVTGTVQSSNAGIPVDIGETSSVELPVIPHKERPPVIMMPARETPQPQDDTTPQPTAQSQAASEPAKVKQASREAAPPTQSKPQNEPTTPTQKPESKTDGPKAESKPPASAPVESKQASREAAPPTQSKLQSEPTAPASVPAESKQASREPVPAHVEPKREIRHVMHKEPKRRREVRGRRAHHVRARKTREFAGFDLFGALFGFHHDPPGGYVPPTAMP